MAVRHLVDCQAPNALMEGDNSHSIAWSHEWDGEVANLCVHSWQHIELER
jgi:hypothetical protein